MTDDLFNLPRLASDLVAPRTLPVIPQRGITEPIEWLPVTTLPDPTSRRMVLLWLAAPLSIGTQVLIGFYDHQAQTWRDIDGHVVRREHLTHWAELPEGPL